MNVLRKLTGTASEEDVQGFRFAVALHDEPVPGFIRQAKFGASGLLLLAREAQQLIPLQELFKLAEANDARFVPPAAPAATAPATGGTHAAAEQRVAEIKAKRLQQTARRRK
jgi:hypothetical protein